MRRVILISSFAVVLCSCGELRLIPITGKYQITTPSYTTTRSFEDAWDRVLDFLQAKKIAISNTDKVSGIITTDRVSFINSYTFETKEGYLRNPYAYVVCASVRGSFTIGESLDMGEVSGQWQFRIKKDDSGSVVEIALTNTRAITGGSDISFYSKRYNRPADPLLLVQSTGEFEKEVASAMR